MFKGQVNNIFNLPALGINKLVDGAAGLYLVMSLPKCDVICASEFRVVASSDEGGIYLSRLLAFGDAIHAGRYGIGHEEYQTFPLTQEVSLVHVDAKFSDLKGVKGNVVTHSFSRVCDRFQNFEQRGAALTGVDYSLLKNRGAIEHVNYRSVVQDNYILEA